MKPAALAVTLLCSGQAAFAQAGVDRFAGPYLGEVVRVIDGDTFEARVAVWPTISATVSVRLRGLDAPELFRPRCVQESLGAAEARDALTELLPPGTLVRLEDVGPDAFGGRVVAEVWRQGERRGRTMAELLTRRQVAVIWNPGDPEPDWCAAAP